MALNDNEWQSLVTLAEWQADKLLFYAIKHSIRVRMPLNVINQQKVFRFPLSVFRFILYLWAKFEHF